MSGQWYSITDHACKVDTFAPFDSLCGFSVHSGNYDGTILRFPLRNEKRERRVSSHVYDISRLHTLLTALRKEAKFILLFLRSVRRIEVFEIAKNGIHSNLFKVSIQETPEDQLSIKRSRFQQQLQSAFQTQSFSITHPIELVSQVCVHVTDHMDQSNSSQSKWLVASRVGSESTDVCETAQALKVLPWVGVALEVSPVQTGDCGRVFCVLPMPPDVCCNLPVHVNGTFSLNDERRALKWQGLETRNDDKAKWNNLIVTHLLPLCYATLLLQHAKMLLKPEDFYRAWPNVLSVRSTHWEGLLRPLLDALLSQAVVWSQEPGGGGGLWVKVSSATFAPRDALLPDVVYTALWACKERLVTAPSRVWDALEYSGTRPTTVTPRHARAKLRQSPASNTTHYSTFSHGQKLELLEYCLSDDAYYDLSNLALLPLANSTFTLFARYQAPVYLCSSQCPRYLLPNLDGELVDMESHGELYTKLKAIADSGYTQLQILKTNDVASLLSRSMPQEWKNQQVVTLPHPKFPQEWLERFWEWILPQTRELKVFSNKLVVPVLGSQSSVSRLNPSAPCVLIPSNTICSRYLISALTKLQVRCCLQSIYPYVQHVQLPELMNHFSADGVLDAIGCASHYNVSLTTEEARYLRTCLVNWTEGGQRSATLQALPIFTTLPNSGEQLHSVAQVKTRSLSRRAQMAPLQCPLSTSNFPSDLLLFSSSDYDQQQILHRLSEVSTATTIDLLISSIVPHIQKGHMTASQTQSLMKEVLDNMSEVTSGATLEKKKKLKLYIAKLPFLPVSSGSLKKPECLFSPSECELEALYRNEPVFPVSPFLTRKCLNILNACGLKTTASPQEIVEIIKAISFPASNQPQVVDTTRYSRAKAVLDYISKWDKQKMSEVVTIEAPTSGFRGGVRKKQIAFSQALKEMSQNRCWLPVQAKHPGEYPDCLDWKGSEYTCHFISIGPSVLLHHNQTPFALACGSQMYFVDHSLPLEICKIFAPDMHQLSRSIILHLERVITNHDQILNMRTITHHIYTLLHDCFSNQGCSIQLSWMQSTQECVWISRYRRFVHPRVVAIQQNPLFRQNLEPFIYTLPDDLEEFSSLFNALGVEDSVTKPQIMGILEKIREGDSASLGVSDGEAWQLVMNILNWLTGNGEHMVDMSDCDTLYVPVEPDSGWPTLVKSEDVVYTDSDFLKRYLSASDSSEYSFTFVNYKVSSQMAHQLCLRPLSECLKISEDAFEDVGQNEPLTLRLKNILKDYKDGLTIVKEMLQNADDAGATEMNICYDVRQHTVQRDSLFFPGMAECHGPALVVHNNAMFTQDDFKNITILAGATKAGKALKIGKFGVGFCSVYHITDVPSFVSDNLLYIFDPTLTYLKDEIKNPALPGKKVTFTSHFISKSSQLAPYKEVFGFNPHHRYEGTMFRFPFRTAASELSGKIYTEEDIQQLIGEIEHSSSKILLFLQNIKCLTFTQFGMCSRELLKITKTTESIGSISIHQVTCTCSGSPSTTDYWVVETCTETVLGRCSTASVACSLLPMDTTDHFRVGEVEGEMFCFLPLSMKTGLPVHVSSNFAVSNNRRGIWTSDDESRVVKEAKWNEALIKQVIPTAYYKLLESLKAMHVDSKLEEYVFYSLWPLEAKLKIHNPWRLLVHTLYSDNIASSELFFSVSTGQWLSLANSRFLATDILRSSFDDSAVSDDVLNVVNYLNLPVVHLPEEYHTYLTLDSSMVTEKVFLQQFFANVNQFDSIVDSRNQVLCLALEAFASELDRQKERYVYLKDYLENNACVPCVPDGQLLRKCVEVIHPRAEFSKLFDLEEKLFPLDQFCDKKLVEMAMKRLGMIHDSISMHLLEKQAHTVSTLYETDITKALERVKLILKYISMQESSLNKGNDSGIANVPFLPVMPKPDDYPLSWCGERKQLLPGRELMLKGKASRYGQTNTNVYIAGSQVPLVCEVEPKDGGCGYLTYVAKGILKVRSSPTPKEVIAHFKHLIEVFSSERTPSTSMIERADTMARQVYEYLDSVLRPPILQGAEPHQPVDLSPISDSPCIWTGKKFMRCDNIAQEWKLKDGPYLFRVPSSIVTRTNLQKALEIKEKFTILDFLNALHFLHDEYGTEQLPDNCQRLVKEIITELLSCFELPNDHPPIMLPDTTFVMHEASQLAFNDAQWLPPEAGYTYVNDSFITRDLAQKLGVKMVRSKRLDKYRSQTRHFKGIPFGQHEDLTRRIQNILRDYPFDVTILKELLQNADDAKATKMYVILDERKHNTERVLSEKWHELQGPALLVWNDSEFTEQDLEGIQKLGLGSKRPESETIGQYGIGFNAVYHLTDCPSFITGGNTLCILDPHCKYAPEADVEFPGERFDGLNTGFWDEFPDMKSSYLRSDLRGCPQELSKGTLFRFPLRHLHELLYASDIIDRSSGNFAGVISAAVMHTHLKKWAPKMKQSMFFLNNVTEIGFFVISESTKSLNMEHCYRVRIDQAAKACREELHSKISQFTKAQGSEPFITKYQLTLEELPISDEKHKEQKWLVQQGIGDVESKSQNWQFIEQVKPRHGIAAPMYHMKNSESFRGTVFCFLPLPVSCNLPVHVNGHFILDSNRRSLWKATNIDEPDDKQQWNVHLVKAIASSYAHFLESAKADYLGNSETVQFKDIQRYYDVFPHWIVPKSSHSSDSKSSVAASSSGEQSTHSKHVVPAMQQVSTATKPAALSLTATTRTKSAFSSSALLSESPVSTAASSSPSSVPSPQIPTNEWLEMAKNVFRTLAERNAPILAVIDHKACPKPQPPGRSEGTKEDKKHFTVEWYPLKAAKECQAMQVYFASLREDVALKIILARIGMKITCAFNWIRKQFKDVGTVVPVLSPTEVYKYYSQFHAQIHISSNSFPCPISHTSFKSAEDFKKFTKYILILPENVHHCEFPEPPFGLPLLLTADHNLRYFPDKGSLKVIKSEYSSVFPQRLQHFLHPTLVDVPYSPTYFLVAGSEQDTTACSEVIENLLASILPRNLKTSCVQSTSVSKEMLSKLWKCLGHDPLFNHHLKDILKQWALLLSCDNKLYSCPSLETILPIMPQQASEGTGISYVLERQLKLPFLETDTVPVDAVADICPRFSCPKTILQVLFHFHNEHDISQLITKCMSETLIKYFSTIHLKMNTECLRYIKELPLFLTANGNLTSLSGKTVYIWPTCVCADGLEIWLKDLNVVFLDKDGAWRSLGLEVELQINKILPIEMYTKFIFVRYNMMNEALRYKHLQHIRDHLLDEAILHSQSELNETHSQSCNFISALKRLKCIGSDGENLRSIQEFYDHEETIFATFEDNFRFLPMFFRKGEGIWNKRGRTTQEEEDLKEYCLWRSFFEKLGLHCTITTDEFLTLCREVAHKGHTKNVQNKSNVLRDYLFTGKATREWYNEKHKRFLSEVAEIPFVCAEEAKKLTWIIPVPKTRTVIQTEGEDMSMTTFRRACVSKHSELVWSVRPIIDPHYSVSHVVYYLQQLLVSYPPQVEDVVQHIVHISKSGFADPKLFDKYSAVVPLKHQTDLTDVMVKCFEFLNSKTLHKAQVPDISILSTTACIPVPAQKIQGTGTVLVKPCQALYSDEAEEYHPFLHKLPQQLMGPSTLLENIGVKSSMQLSHLRTVLQLAHDQLQAHVMGPNIQRTVSFAIHHIQGMLKGGQVVRMKDEVEVAKQLKPLFLPGHDKKLHDSTVLIYPDTFSYKDCCLHFENTGYFQFQPPFIPSTELYTFTDEFCGILPKEVRPQRMSEVCLQKLSEQCTPLEENIGIAKQLIETLSLPNFPKACFMILKHVSPNDCDKSLEPILAKLFKSIVVHTVNNLKVDIALRQHQRMIGTAKVAIFIQQGEGHTQLYLDSQIPAVLRSYVYDVMTQELIITLKNVCCTLPGSVFSHKTLQEALRMLLEAERLQDMHTVFQQHKIKSHGTDLGVPELSPVVGREIPPELHYILDQDILNIFHSQELVGYELNEGHIIIAEVIHIVLPDDFDPLESSLDPIQMKYMIQISESDEGGRTVSSLDIYKILNILEHDPSMESSEDRRLVPHEGGNASSPFQSARDAKRNLCQVLKQIWKLSEPERKKAIRRLYLKWHPDKNPDNLQLAEEVFKFLLKQLERLEQGLDPEEEEEEDTSTTFSPSPYWSSYYHGWDSTAGAHGRHRRRHREYYRNGSQYSSGGSCGYNYERPQGDPDRARQWVKQAEIDSEALEALLRSAHANPRLASHVCFMAHEVAEKALKGGMYATCGLGANSLTKHDISPLAYALQGERMQIAAELPSFTIPLKPHYLNTRFPNRYSPPTVPSDRYSLSDAQEAQMNAMNILRIVKQIL